MKRELIALRVEFVCWANICRSPFADAYANSQADPDLVEFTSSGLHASLGRPMDELMADELRSIGVTPRPDGARPTVDEIVSQADLILTMEASQRRDVLDEWPGAVRKVFTLGQFAKMMADQTTSQPRAEVLREVFDKRWGADQKLDVDDPYRRGQAAANVAAQRIMGMVDAVLWGLQLFPEPRRAL